MSDLPNGFQVNQKAFGGHYDEYECIEHFNRQRILDLQYAEVLDKITKSYLASDDYNGLQVTSLIRDYDEAVVKKSLIKLISHDFASLVFGDYHPNPHVKALPSESNEEQIKKIHQPIFWRACVYPNPKHLGKVVDKNKYIDRPYTLCMALGEPQLSHKSFDLSVLETYRNDPRYLYRHGGIQGSISIRDGHYSSEEMRESDKILLKTFGICFDEVGTPHVASFLIYLAGLSPEHQSIWASRQVKAETQLHPDYYRSAILGQWPERLSIFTAILLEIKTINDLCRTIGRQPLFKKDFYDETMPPEFWYLLRPTSKEYNGFLHILDKMLSENIDKKFFKNDIPLTDESERNDGKIIIQTKYTIRLLEEWVKEYFKTDDWTEIEEAFSTLKNIRKERQKPAHHIEENEFDPEYIQKQRKLLKSVYRVVKILRVVLSFYPLAEGVMINKHLLEGKIWPA